MMNYRHYRDDGRNYMAIETDVIDEFGYEYRMAYHNRLQWTLESRTRTLDGHSYHYYDVTGFVPLEDWAESLPLDETEIRRLFTCLQSAKRELEAYLINPERLLLQPEGIFRRMSDGSYRFCLQPVAACEEDTADLAAWLMEHTREDAAAKRLIEDAVRLGAGSLLQGVCMETQEDERETVQKRETKTPSYENGLTPSAFLDEKDFTAPEDVFSLYDGTEDMDYAPAYEVYGSKADEEDGRGKTLTLIFAVIFAVTCVAIVYLRLNYDLTLMENILSAAAGVVSLIMGAACVLRLRKEGIPKRQKRKKTEGEDAPVPDGIMEKTSAVRDALFFRQDMAREREAVSEQNGAEYAENPLDTAAFGEADAETVLLQTSDSRQAHRLYSIDEERLIKVDLKHLPLTIGKLPGVADFLLKKEGVSRLHARFFADAQNEVCMKDLNSTNGTYRNGVRLQGGETVTLHEGDEIKIGPVAFTFT